MRIETSFTSETMDEIDEIIMRPKLPSAEPKARAVLAGNSNCESHAADEDEEGSDSESEYSSGEEEILNHRFKDGQYNPAKGTRYEVNQKSVLA